MYLPTYAAEAKITFLTGCDIDLAGSGDTYKYCGKYRVSGDRVTVTFGKIQDKALKDLSGATVIFRIEDAEPLVDVNDGTTWVRIQ